MTGEAEPTMISPKAQSTTTRRAMAGPVPSLADQPVARRRDGARAARRSGAGVAAETGAAGRRRNGHRGRRFGPAAGPAARGLCRGPAVVRPVGRSATVTPEAARALEG